jgi:hypothetical protein
MGRANCLLAVGRGNPPATRPAPSRSFPVAAATPSLPGFVHRPEGEMLGGGTPRPGGKSYPVRLTAARPLFLGVVELAVGQLALRLVPQLPHTGWQSVHGRSAEPRFNDLEKGC